MLAFSDGMGSFGIYPILEKSLSCGSFTVVQTHGEFQILLPGYTLQSNDLFVEAIGKFPCGGFYISEMNSQTKLELLTFCHGEGN